MFAPVVYFKLGLLTRCGNETGVQARIKIARSRSEFGSEPQNGIKFLFLFFQFVILIFLKLICFLLSGKYHNHNYNLQNKGQSRIKTKAEAEDKLDIGR